MFSETLVPEGGGHFDATTTKLCKVIVCHISIKSQQLDFQIPIVLLSVAVVLFGA